jgi:hypothetical protein
VLAEVDTVTGIAKDGIMGEGPWSIFNTNLGIFQYLMLLSGNWAGREINRAVNETLNSPRKQKQNTDCSTSQAENMKNPIHLKAQLTKYQTSACSRRDNDKPKPRHPDSNDSENDADSTRFHVGRRRKPFYVGAEVLGLESNTDCASA